MFFDPDKFDAVIVIFKFLAVFSCGLLAGQSLFLSRAPFKCLLAMVNADKISLRVFRFSGTTVNLYMYRLNLLACFAGFAVFLLEIRDRHYWLYGVLGLLLVLLYTKFYLCPRIIDHLMAPDFAKKSESHTESMISKFQQRHHGRTVLLSITFVWLIYSLYVS